MSMIRQIYAFVSGHFRRAGGLSRTNWVNRLPDGSYLKKPGPIFYRKGRPYDPALLLQREIHCLRLLQSSPHFPRIVDSDKRVLCLESGGLPVTAENLPTDWREQSREILSELQKTGVAHRDIKLGNLLVDQGRLVLIDFGWAQAGAIPPMPVPHEPIEDALALEGVLLTLANQKT